MTTHKNIFRELAESLMVHQRDEDETQQNDPTPEEQDR